MRRFEDFLNDKITREAFMAGFVAALRSQRIYSPALFLQEHQLELYIRGEVAFVEERLTKDLATKKRIIGGTGDDFKAESRGMCLDKNDCITDPWVQAEHSATITALPTSAETLAQHIQKARLADTQCEKRSRERISRDKLQ